jgi:6-phosphogluconolactonase
MPAELSSTRWHSLADPETVAQAAVDRILAAGRNAINDRGVFRIVLAGGRTPEVCYRRLAEAPTDWSRWKVYFGDERCLPPEHAERNSTMVSRVWLSGVRIPAENVYPIPAELGAEAASRAYEPRVREALPFDMVILGMGEDGHTASLFPGQRHPAAELVHAIHNAPKPPPDRVSLSTKALSEAREVLILVTGFSKQAAVRAWRAGKPLPVAQIQGYAGVDVLLDPHARV